jgi:hypothetical protein
MPSNSVVLVQHSITNLWSYIPIKTFCVISKSNGRSSTSTIAAKWKAITMGWDEPRCSCGNKALKSQIFKVCCLQFVVRKRLYAEMFWNGKSFNSYKETAQAVVHERYRSDHKMVSWGHPETAKKTAERYRPRREICWTRSCVTFSLKITKLLQMRCVQITKPVIYLCTNSDVI